VQSNVSLASHGSPFRSQVTVIDSGYGGPPLVVSHTRCPPPGYAAAPLTLTQPLLRQKTISPRVVSYIAPRVAKIGAAKLESPELWRTLLETCRFRLELQLSRIVAGNADIGLGEAVPPGI
jgi:hypothetical protein